MDDEIDEDEWLRSGAMNDVFEFLADDGEDILLSKTLSKLV